MTSHQFRVIVILLAWAIAFISLIILIVNQVTDGTGFGAVIGILGTLTPALIDSLAVEKRRRTPGQHAVEDDKT